MIDARWRISDPITSKLAALSIDPESISDCKRRILSILEKPMTDEQLVAAYENQARMTGAAAASPSGIRSRRATLTELGLIKEIGYGKTITGRKAIIWQVSNV